MTGALYEPRRYWSERLRRSFSLDGVGYQGLGMGMNYWVYRRRLNAVRRLFKKHQIDLQGKRVAEMGVGTGFWIEEWTRLGAARVFGLDIAPPSIEFLTQRYPEYDFAVSDLGTPGVVHTSANDNRFDFIAVMEVLLHIVDDMAFDAALDNIASLAKPGTWLLMSDLFLPVEVRAFHQRSRPLSQYRRVMTARGFDLVDRVPVFCSLHPTEFALTGARRYLARIRWYLTAGLVWFMPAAGWGLGLVLFLIDSAWSRLGYKGRSTHLTLWRCV
jgi:SAM-dependent methyltransferase